MAGMGREVIPLADSHNMGSATVVSRRGLKGTVIAGANIFLARLFRTPDRAEYVRREHRLTAQACRRSVGPAWPLANIP